MIFLITSEWVNCCWKVIPDKGTPGLIEKPKFTVLFGHILHSRVFALGICLERTVWVPKMTLSCASQWMERLPTFPWTLGYVEQSTCFCVCCVQQSPVWHSAAYSVMYPLAKEMYLVSKQRGLLIKKMLAMFMQQMQYI